MGRTCRVVAAEEHIELVIGENNAELAVELLPEHCAVAGMG